MSALPPPTPPRARSAIIRSRILKGSLITLGLGTVAFVALVIFALIQLEGGWPWAFTTAPVKTDREVVEANAAGDGERNKLVAGIQKAGNVADLERVTASPSQLSCDTGQHNWKRNDNFDLQCDSKISVVLGSAIPAETPGRDRADWNTRNEALLKTQLLKFHEQLLAAGWSTSYPNASMTSVKDLFDTPAYQGRPTWSSFLDQNGAAQYFHGDKGGQGSATIYIEFTKYPDDYAVDKLEPFPFQTAQPYAEEATTAYNNAKAYLDGAHYLANIQLTYVSFRG